MGGSEPQLSFIIFIMKSLFFVFVLAGILYFGLCEVSTTVSYIPPGWTQDRLAAATVDDLSQLPHEVQLRPHPC